MQAFMGVDFICGGCYLNHMGGQTFGERLREIREGRLVRTGRKIGVRQLGEISGVNHAQISQAERNKAWVDKLPSPETLRALADGLSVSMRQLLGDEVFDRLFSDSIDPDTERRNAEKRSRSVAERVSQERTREFAEIGERVVSLVHERSNIIPGPPIRRVPSATVRLPILNALSAQDAGNLDRQVTDHIDVPAWLVEGVGDPVLFVVSGDCLAADNLATGDLVIIDRAITEPYDGEIVAARVDGAETLKHWHHLGDRVELRPSSPGFAAIVVRESDVRVIGVFAGVMRRGGRGRRKAG